MSNAALHRTVVAGLALATAIIATGVARADVLVDCKSARSGEMRIAACSEIIASRTVDPSVRAEALRRRAAAYAERAANREAESDYTEALRLEPAVASSLTARANVRLALGNADGAISDLTDAIRMGGGTAGLLMARGYAHLVKNDADAALADFDAVVALQPKNAPTTSAASPTARRAISPRRSPTIRAPSTSTRRSRRPTPTAAMSTRPRATSWRRWPT